MGVILRRHSQVRLYYGAWGNRGTGMNLSRLTMLGCLSLLCMSCGGGASQATETVQASQTIQTTGSTTSANDSGTAAGNACTNFNGVNSFGQQIVNTEACTLNHDGIERDYFIHVPDQQTDTNRLPVVLSFHGYTSSAETNLNYTGLQPLAESEGFIAVYPQGTILPVSGEAHWNSGRGFTDKSDTDDLGFVETLIDHLNASRNIDADRVYAIGMSNGGMMSYLLACQLSQRVAAIVSVTGSMTVESATCTASRPVPVMHIHGVEDAVVPFAGGNGFTAITPTIEFWAQSNGCVGDPQQTAIADITGDGYGGQRTRYLDCSQGTEVELIALDAVGHDWPINVDGYRRHDVHAADEIWYFLKRFSLYGG